MVPFCARNIMNTSKVQNKVHVQNIGHISRVCFGIVMDDGSNARQM